jgi:N-acetyl-D-muramate 6-phosphate phosphatase
MAATLRAVLFDLDGTVLDTAPDMVGALNRLREEHSLAPLPFDAVHSPVSHGAARVVKTGFPGADAVRLDWLKASGRL